MRRRDFLTATGAAAAAGLAGCSSTTELPTELSGTESNPDQLPRPTRGDGAVTVDVFKDHGCPACHQYYLTIFPEIRENYIDTGDITYNFYDYPLPADERTVVLNNAARAVQDDTRTSDDPNGAFWEYVELLYTNTDSWTDSNLGQFAEDVGADPDFVQGAIDTEQYYPQLVADWNEANRREAEGTPSVYVEGQQVDTSLADITQAIDQHL